MINTLKIDTNKTIEYMNVLRDIINDIHDEIHTCNDDNKTNLNNKLQTMSAKLNAVKTVLIINGYSVDYIDDEYIIY